MVLGVCLALEGLLFLLDYHVNYGRWTEIGALRRMFNTTRDDGLASWLGTTQTLFLALTVWLTYWMQRAVARPRWAQRGWMVLAIFFTYMAVDDGATIHERLGTAYRMKVLASESSFGFPSYAWQVAVLPALVLMGFFTFAFLLRELRSRRAKVTLFVALSGLALAVGVDFVEELERDHPMNAYRLAAERYQLDAWTEARFHHSAYSTLRHFSKSVEETLEMASMSMIWFVFLCHLLGSTRALRVNFGGYLPPASPQALMG